MIKSHGIIILFSRNIRIYRLQNEKNTCSFLLLCLTLSLTACGSLSLTSHTEEPDTPDKGKISPIAIVAVTAVAAGGIGAAFYFINKKRLTK